MEIYYLRKLNQSKVKKLCQRPALNFADVFAMVKKIMKEVKKDGDQALKKYTKKFDKVSLNNFAVSRKEIDRACKNISPEVKKVLKKASLNIEKFQKGQFCKGKKIETTKGVVCFREERPIEKVGLYIPGGTAPLPSTVLMLGIPAKIAGCREVVLCTPPQKNGKVPDVILYAAKLCNIIKIFKVGGAQAIAAMSYGTKTIPKVYKIFGPGNQYVTAAKMLLTIEPEGTAIDLPAGPTELLVIADKKARADFVASDLLSQAEHGPDSQVVLVCTSSIKAKEILKEVEKQLKSLSRKEIAAQSLKNSFVLIAENLNQAIEFSNCYAPEHLILNIKNPKSYINKIINAGSVFLGPYSSESAGDYASGPNHTLPTYGYARMYSGVSVENFAKQITFQEVTRKGAKNLGPIVTKMAEIEGLAGHKKAMEIRLLNS